jgi:GntR family transcriptional regulator
MAFQAPTPKYVRVLNELRERIEAGRYGPGAALPSENQMSAEFGVSRPTVLKALGILRQDGWIESQQGRGHFVRGRLPVERVSPQYTRDVIGINETLGTEVLHVGPVLAPARIATVLDLAEGTPVYERRVRTVSDLGPIDLISTFVPVDVAFGTEITKPDPIGESLLEHIERRRGVRGDYAREWMTTRAASPDEVTALAIDPADPVLSVVIGVYQSSGDPIMASRLLMPGSRHEIEDVYSLS